MKKLVLIALLMVSSFISKCEHNEHHINVYEISDTLYINDGDNTYLQLMFICAVLSAKYTTYTFRTYRFGGVITFNAYTTDCWLSMKLNRKANLCQVDFNSIDDSFDYDRFINIIDSLF